MARIRSIRPGRSSGRDGDGLTVPMLMVAVARDDSLDGGPGVIIAIGYEESAAVNAAVDLMRKRAHASS